MSTTFYFASLSTGRFDGSHMSCNDESEAFHSAPPGMVPVQGVTDWQHQYLDLDTGTLAACEPVSPGPDYEFRRGLWLLKPEIAKRQAKRAELLAGIAVLEQRKLRPLGALLLDPTNAEERAWLADFESQIAALRAQLV